MGGDTTKALNLVLVSFTAVACCSCKPDGPAADPDKAVATTEIVIAGTEGKSVTILAEVVATDEARQKGLMFRRQLRDGRGMLFVFRNQEVHSFWMKNTYITLDIIFINDDKKIVGIVREAKPRSEGSLTVGVPSRYVLEVPAGYCNRMQIHRGAALDFDL